MVWLTSFFIHSGEPVTTHVVNDARKSYYLFALLGSVFIRSCNFLSLLIVSFAQMSFLLASLRSLAVELFGTAGPGRHCGREI